jgi:hypothetical protein
MSLRSARAASRATEKMNAVAIAKTTSIGKKQHHPKRGSILLSC